MLPSIFHSLSNTHSELHENLYFFLLRCCFSFSIPLFFSRRLRISLVFPYEIVLAFDSFNCYSLLVWIFYFVTAFSIWSISIDCKYERQVCHRVSCIMTRDLWPIPRRNCLQSTFNHINTFDRFCYTSYIACLNFFPFYVGFSLLFWVLQFVWDPVHMATSCNY